MTNAVPTLIAINHDDDHAEYVGHTKDGRQFFLTTPFVPADEGEAGSEFVALFLFDAKGNFLDAKIDNFGPRADMDDDAQEDMIEKRLKELGEVRHGRIEIVPFSVKKFGYTFGLIMLKPERGEPLSVEMQPGSYMVFSSPWDSGKYES